AARLNHAELADPVRRYDDSVLVSLLLVCLYDACDTGQGDFRSQFAGIKKLLALRRNAVGRCSEALEWCARTFVYYDCTTATINNRNLEFSPGLVDYLSLGNDEWTIENTFGCDVRLFKLITQLDGISRLNQECRKSQQRFITNPAIFGTLSPEFHEAEFWRQWYRLKGQIESWNMRPFERTDPASQAMYSEDVFQPQPQPQPVFATSPQPHGPANTQPFPPPISAVSTPYWREGPVSSGGVGSSSNSLEVEHANYVDLTRISQSFRYSALIYLERLAYPELPSSHPRIQQLVHISMHYINSVESSTSLLWPMLITGSECISEAHREIIRSRCNIIYGDAGFFNSVITLGLLEEIWAGRDSNANRPTTTESAGVSQGAPMQGTVPVGYSGASIVFSQNPSEGVSTVQQHPFRWLTVIASGQNKGEYIVS
ncbi:hypothetical protein KEM56_003483, partial [Ascosphaera pollenicola]